MQVPAEATRGCQILRTEVTGGGEPPSWVLGTMNHSGPVRTFKQSMLLITEPSLQYFVGAGDKVGECFILSWILFVSYHFFFFASCLPCPLPQPWQTPKKPWAKMEPSTLKLLVCGILKIIPYYRVASVLQRYWCRRQTMVVHCALKDTIMFYQRKEMLF